MRVFWDNAKMVLWIFLFVGFISWSADVLGQRETPGEEIRRNKGDSLKVEIGNLPPMLYQEMK